MKKTDSLLDFSNELFTEKETNQKPEQKPTTIFTNNLADIPELKENTTIIMPNQESYENTITINGKTYTTCGNDIKIVNGKVISGDVEIDEKDFGKDTRKSFTKSMTSLKQEMDDLAEDLANMLFDI